jgi:hypothetical protein
MIRALTMVMVAAVLAAGAGCVERTITITSEPPGALVWLNEREVGRTPLDVDFLYYGEYDVRLERDGYEPLMTSGHAAAPLWDTIPLDLGAELVPAELRSHVRWHYVLEPRMDDAAALEARAATLRAKAGAAGEGSPAGSGEPGSAGSPEPIGSSEPPTPPDSPAPPEAAEPPDGR